MKSLLNELQHRTFIDLILMAKCGELDPIACLCDPDQREVISLLKKRVPSLAQRTLLLHDVCASCAAQVTGVAETSSMPPSSSSGSVDSKPPATNHVVSEVCQLAGAGPTDLYPLWTKIGKVSRPELTGREVGQLAWCGLLATYVLAGIGKPVFWELGCCIRADTGSIEVGVVGRSDIKSTLQQWDVLVDPEHFGHHVLVSVSDGQHISIVEGNTPSIACWSAKLSTIVERYRGWLIKRHIP